MDLNDFYKENLLFDWQYYIFINKDLFENNIIYENDAINHYILYGKNENRIINNNNFTPETKNIRCHLILLEKNKQRYDYVKKIIQENNNINIFYAIDKNNKKNIDYFVKKYNIKLFNYGEIACALSHLLLIKNFIKSKSKYQIVLEDDLKIVKKLVRKLK